MIEKLIRRAKQAAKERIYTSSASRGRELAAEIDECIEFFESSQLQHQKRHYRKNIFIHVNRVTIGFLGHHRYSYEEQVVDSTSKASYTERFEIDRNDHTVVHKISYHSGEEFIDQNISAEALIRARDRIRTLTIPYKEHLEKGV